MQTSYKFWYITRSDDGYILEAAIRFYEGETAKRREYKEDGSYNMVTKYRRAKQLTREDMSHFADKRTKKEANGNDTVVFTQGDFGQIKTDQELVSFLNMQLAKDSSRTPINEQTA